MKLERPFRHLSCSVYVLNNISSTFRLPNSFIVCSPVFRIQPVCSLTTDIVYNVVKRIVSLETSYQKTFLASVLWTRKGLVLREGPLLAELRALWIIQILFCCCTLHLTTRKSFEITCLNSNSDVQQNADWLLDTFLELYRDLTVCAHSTWMRLPHYPTNVMPVRCKK